MKEVEIVLRDEFSPVMKELEGLLSRSSCETVRSFFLRFDSISQISCFERVTEAYGCRRVILLKPTVGLLDFISMAKSA